MARDLLMNLDTRHYELKYTRCYCEENIYLLCKEIKEKQKDLLQNCFVIYISNKDRMVPLWKQKAGVGEQPVVWDYHVILYFKKESKSKSYIYDYDSVLSFPSPVCDYIFATFKPDIDLKIEFSRSFRLIPAETYLSEFSSDRSHMIKPDGSYYAEPPLYPNIKAGHETMNLNKFISMEDYTGAGKDRFGQVYSTIKFLRLAFDK